MTRLKRTPKHSRSFKRVKAGAPKLTLASPFQVDALAAIPAPLYLAGAFALVVLTVAVYYPVGKHPFTNYDDGTYVTENQPVREGLTWRTVAWASTSMAANNWHPITWLSHALDFQLYSTNAGGHHWTSIWIHALNSALLFVLLGRATHDLRRSWIVAALFAVHPLNVESVAWIAERKSVLSTLFLLLAVGAYGWYARRPRVRRYLVVVALFAFGLMAKPVLVTLPFALLLLDYWPLQRITDWCPPSEYLQKPFSTLCLEKLPLLAMSVGSAVVTLFAQRGSMTPVGQISLALRIENAAVSYAVYLKNAIWPTQLAPLYPYPSEGLAPWKWIAAGVLLAAVSALVWKQRSIRPYVIVGWCWFLGTLVPMLGIVQVGAQAMADRYAYVPLVGIFVAVIWSVKATAKSGVFIATVGIVLLALSLATRHQIGFWKSNYDLWSHTLSVAKNNWMAEDKLGGALEEMGKHDDAVGHFAVANALYPSDPLSNFNLGADLQFHGHVKEAIRRYEMTIAHTTDSRLLAQAYENLGTGYLQLGDRTRARENYLLALKSDRNLLTVFAGLGELAGEPARTLSIVAVRNPDADRYFQLAQAFQQDHLLPEARLAYSEAVEENPELLEARRALSSLKGSDRP
jgi:protein O-mannosyl-transferase